tara:strand:- start:3436 stop:4869 length:1434 start_codon:yes stop_codon:yes gene_type:complete
MARNNDVFTIIPLKDDTTLQAAGVAVGAMTANKVGIFDYDTGLSIAAAGVAAVRKFFIAMAVDTTGDGLRDEIIKSAGTHIQKKNVMSYNTRCYTPGRTQILEVVNFTASCDTQYALKVDINNGEKHMNFGFSQLAKTFLVKTGCCSGCETCPSGDCPDLVSKLIASINADEDGLMVASATANIGSLTFTAGSPTVAGDFTVKIGTDAAVTVTVAAADTAVLIAAKTAAALTANSKYTATSDGVSKVTIVLADGTTLSAAKAIVFTPGSTAVTAVLVNVATTAVADLVVFAADNPGACPTLKIESVVSAVKSYCDINGQYYYPRDTRLTISFPQELGFDCNGVVKTVQEPALQEGFGYDLAQVEYNENGAGKSPYKVGTMAAIPFSETQFIVKTGTYDRVDITYDLESTSGWLEYKNNLNTSIVFPCTDPASGIGIEVVEILDALLPDFDAKADDLVLCTCVLLATEDQSAAEDGLG